MNYDDGISIVNCNGGFCAALGFFKEELIGSRLSTIMPLNDEEYL